ncbi:MAG: hypothetical protein LUC22_01310 [Prevotella sp.]|nr:hypothetical protein [Prevotella sp.]
MIAAVSDKLIPDVRIALDRNRVNNDLLAVDINTRMLDEAIHRNITDGVRTILSVAPVIALGEGKSFTGGVLWGNQGAGAVILPADFYRLITFRMSDWARGVSPAAFDSDPRYALQSSPVKALRGTAERPEVFIIQRAQGKALEFYSSDSEDATVAEAAYIPLPYIVTGEDGDEVIDIPTRLYRACVCEIAALTALERGAADTAQALQSRAQSLTD